MTSTSTPRSTTLDNIGPQSAVSVHDYHSGVALDHRLEYRGHDIDVNFELPDGIGLWLVCGLSLSSHQLHLVLLSRVTPGAEATAWPCVVSAGSTRRELAPLCNAADNLQSMVADVTGWRPDTNE